MHGFLARVQNFVKLCRVSFKIGILCASKTGQFFPRKQWGFRKQGGAEAPPVFLWDLVLSGGNIGRRRGAGSGSLWIEGERQSKRAGALWEPCRHRRPGPETAG